MLDKINDGIYGLRKKLKNVSPLTKWSYKCNIYKVYDKNKLKALGSDKLRKSVSSTGDLCYIMKSNGKELLPPPPGYEDRADAVTLLELENDYKYMFPEFDTESEHVILRIRDDETMKYLYSQKQIDTALRFSPELAWYQNGIFYLIVLFIITVVWFVITQTTIAASLTSATSSFITALQENTQALTSVGGQLTNLGSKPPI